MRIFSCLILLVSVLMFAKAGYDEHRGITRVRTGRGQYEVVTKARNSEQFHNAMTYHWSYAMIVLIAGIITYAIENGLEKSDPFSPDFAGNKDLDEWGDAMKKEEERRNHPNP